MRKIIIHCTSHAKWYTIYIHRQHYTSHIPSVTVMFVDNDSGHMQQSLESKCESEWHHLDICETSSLALQPRRILKLSAVFLTSGLLTCANGSSWHFLIFVVDILQYFRLTFAGLIDFCHERLTIKQGSQLKWDLQPNPSFSPGLYIYSL